MINVPLLRKVMEHIEAHPEEHDQASWAERTDCGTTYCFAGWAVMLGAPDARFAYVDDCASTLADGRPIGSTAQQLLGLTWRQSYRLFHGCDTAEELRAAVNELIAAAEPVTPAAAPPGVTSAGGGPDARTGLGGRALAP